MANELYFIPLLLNAYDAPDRRAALVEAFTEIMRRGNEPGFEIGAKQFQLFMRIVLGAISSDIEDDRLLLDLFMRSEEPSAVVGDETREVLEHLLNQHPQYRQIVEDLRSVIEPLTDQDLPIEIVLEHEHQRMDTHALIQAPGKCRISGLIPGDYTLRMAIGRVLWQGTLVSEDLEWAKAHPSRPLSMAAATGEEYNEPTREFDLLGGELLVKVFPGLEAGTMVISVAARDN